MEEIDAVDLRERLQALEERVRLLRQHLRSPDSRSRGLVVEVAHRQLAEDDEIVVADEADVCALLHLAQQSFGRGP